MHEIFDFELLMGRSQDVKAEGHLTSPGCEDEWLEKKKACPGAKNSVRPKGNQVDVLNYIIMYI